MRNQSVLCLGKLLEDLKIWSRFIFRQEQNFGLRKSNSHLQIQAIELQLQRFAYVFKG